MKAACIQFYLKLKVKAASILNTASTNSFKSTNLRNWLKYVSSSADWKVGWKTDISGNNILDKQKLGILLMDLWNAGKLTFRVIIDLILWRHIYLYTLQNNGNFRLQDDVRGEVFIKTKAVSFKSRKSHLTERIKCSCAYILTVQSKICLYLTIKFTSNQISIF